MSPDPQATPSVDPREIDAEMIRTLYHRVVPLVFANFGALILLTAALWTSTERTYLLLWAGALSCWTMVRFALAHVYMREERSLEETGRWTLAFAIGSTIAGCLWGSSTLLIDDLGSDKAGLITAFIMAALSAAAIAGYTNSLAAFVGFVLPSLLPYSLRLIHLDGTADLQTAAFVVFWGALLWIMARHQNKGFRDTIALGLRNRNLARRLAGERDRAAAANEAKTRFLGNMSHELRTPLNAIIGYADMMRNQMLGPIGNERYVEYVGGIFDSGSHLLSVFDQILEVSRLETGGTDLAQVAVDLPRLVRNVVAERQPQLEERQLDLSVSAIAGLPPVLGDPARLRQIVDALLDNAIRFTPSGGCITIRLDGSARTGLGLAIADTGAGMDRDRLRQVLIPFALMEQQEHLKRAGAPEQVGGHTRVGLGLPLVSLLAQAHGATFELDSTPGAGTTACVHFPPERIPAEPARLTA